MKYFLLFILSGLIPVVATAQCNSEQAQIKVVLKTDQFPNEDKWELLSSTGAIQAKSRANMSANTTYYDSICVDAGYCNFFRITDLRGDGICCMQGHGYFDVYYNGLLAKSDSNFGYVSVGYMGCPPGKNCSSSNTVFPGTYTAPAPNIWYDFNPSSSGFYNISTCSLGNSCNTRIWIYDYCNNLIFDTTQLGSIYYVNDNCDTTHESINAYLNSGTTYYIRIGDVANSCNGDSIYWSLKADTAISGCTDPAACNYNVFATVSVPSSCRYYPSPDCPTGPDLKLDSAALVSSVAMDTVNGKDVCSIKEGCINGYDLRQIITFDTKIESIGATDYYVGPPPSSPSAYSSVFNWDPCHGHWHYKDYAEYLLVDSLDNFVPIGYKNGFCIEDFVCSSGFPKYGCNNMGLTAGCADEYATGLPCQWIDVTNVKDGNYKLIVRVNWVPRPDFYGRYEVSYFNNWARACIKIYHDSLNVRRVSVSKSCTPYYDCSGVENGLSIKDCADSCNGRRVKGDINQDGILNNIDLANYMAGALYYDLPATKCVDLNDDSNITVTDAALLWDCAMHGPGALPPNHTHHSCFFPNIVTNPNENDTFSISMIDTVHKLIEISLTNPDNGVIGYQIKIKGISLSKIDDLMPPNLNYQYYFSSIGGIIGLSLSETPIAKSNLPVPLIRLHYSSINSLQVCIDSIITVENEAYEQVIHAVAANDKCLGIAENNISVINTGPIDHEIVPDPFTKTTILMIASTNNDRYSVILYDILGRKLRAYPTQSSHILGIDKNDLSPGVYYISVISERWQFKEKLIIE